MIYAAFLGNQPTLSLAELFASVSGLTLRRMVTPQIALLDSPVQLTFKDLKDCGGLFLLAEEISGASLQKLPETLRDQVKNVKGKVTFSIRSWGIDRRKVHDLYRDLKNGLKKNGIPSRYIGNELKPPVSGQLHDAGLITGKEGCELVLLADDDTNFLWIGRTVAAQDPDSYTKRDMQKPVRDTRAGLLPPKLAQMMLNFGGWIARDVNPKAPKHLTILDPFCGTGVIPMESLLKGWPVLASDVSVKAVNGCEKNLEWIRKEEKILKKDTASEVWKQDATKPFSLKNKPDVIVTESMLGTPFSERPTAKDAAKERAECDALETAFLQNVAKTLPGVPVVVMFPVWYVKAGPVFLEQVWKQLPKIGFEAVLPPGAVSDSQDHPSLLYRRADQFVGREIVMLKPLHS
jgi:hypothetical protein